MGSSPAGATRSHVGSGCSVVGGYVRGAQSRQAGELGAARCLQRAHADPPLPKALWACPAVCPSHLVMLGLVSAPGGVCSLEDMRHMPRGPGVSAWPCPQGTTFRGQRAKDTEEPPAGFKLPVYPSPNPLPLPSNLLCGTATKIRLSVMIMVCKYFSLCEGKSFRESRQCCSSLQEEPGFKKPSHLAVLTELISAHYIMCR